MRIEMPLGCGFSPSVVLSQWEKVWALPENFSNFYYKMVHFVHFEVVFLASFNACRTVGLYSPCCYLSDS